MDSLKTIKNRIADQWAVLSRVADESNVTVGESLREIVKLEKTAECEHRSFGRNLGVQRFPLSVSLAARRIALQNLRNALDTPARKMTATEAASYPRRRLLVLALAEQLRKQLKTTTIGRGLGDSDLVGGKVAA